MYLAITVLATITLYYELYVGGSVSTLILANLHMSFTFFVLTLAFGALIGAFGSLFAGITDRLGRANLVVFGLFFTAVFVAFIMPTATDKWVFTIESWVVGFVEGICLVATPALIRDFSPQVGRATAMGFWTSGPVIGSLIVSVVGSATVPAIVNDDRFWTHEYRICGIAGLVVFVIALVGLKELSPRLRDQLMVTLRDRALIEAKAKGLTDEDIEAALRRPFRQLLKTDVIVSSIAVSIMLLIYYTAVAFAVIYLTTVFGFSVKDANGLGNWNWGFNVLAVILVGVISDRFRVRKPFMVIGGVLAAVMTVIYLEQAGHHPSYYSLAIMLALLSLGLGIAYTPWMASFTETVEARNPALIATGLAIWGWIIRIVVFLAYLCLPLVVNTVTPLVNYGAQVQAYATQYKTELAFASAHPDIVATAQKIPPNVTAAAQRIPPDVIAIAQKDSVQLANAQKFAPELKVIQANPALFSKLATYSDPSKIPGPLLTQAINAAGGGAKGVAVLTTISQNKAAINGVIAVAPDLQKVAPHAADLQTIAPYSAQLTKIAPYGAQLTALSKVPPSVFTYLKAHGADVQNAAAKTAGQWKTWYWICFGGIVFFLLSIPLLRGRWRTRDAKRDEAEHEAKVQEELAKLQAAV
ncbi:MAG TPA: MFS transporter [Streptosporangiaceae bacterium]|jgi:ACS family D-galactonate transporter-like MFS transporter|nr:MFS transporter [Streptosporangiaceae bacterium]